MRDQNTLGARVLHLGANYHTHSTKQETPKKEFGNVRGNVLQRTAQGAVVLVALFPSMRKDSPSWYSGAMGKSGEKCAIKCERLS